MQSQVRRVSGIDGVSLHLSTWSPDDPTQAVGVVQLLHGQGEYSGRYTHVAEHLTERGFIVYANDHRGHGLTVFDPAEDAPEEHRIPGHMADHDGWRKCLADCGLIRGLIQREQPELPFFLIGHSLGSFMVQDLLIEDSTRWDAAILLGSAGGPLTLQQRMLEIVVRLQYLVKGKRGPATWTDKVIMEAFAKQVGIKEYRSEWLTTDPEMVLAAHHDPMMNFAASAQHWMDLAAAIKARAVPANIAKVRADIPLWIASGQDDPIGQNGEAVEALVKAYQTAGLTDVTLRLFDGMRHEMHNERERDAFLAEMSGWMLTKMAA